MIDSTSKSLQCVPLKQPSTDLVPMPLPELHYDSDDATMPELLNNPSQTVGIDDILIIPGTGIPLSTPVPRHTRRHYRVHVAVMILSSLIVLSLLVFITPLNQAITGSTLTLKAAAAAIVRPPPPLFIDYRVQPGDTYEKLSTRFNTPINGIFKINHFYAQQELQVGQSIHISTKPDFGADYIPPPLPVQKGYSGLGTNNGFGSCLFCARGGVTNGTGKMCAPISLQQPVDISHYNLAQPDASAHWVRGFTWDHNGVDISTGVLGSPITAVQSGVVIFSGWDPYGAGYSIKINHCGGLASSYSHLEKILVTPGQEIQQGATIGLQGSTGNSTGAHLHFMLWWNNTPFDPLCAFSSLVGVGAASHYGGCPAPQLIPAP